MAALFQLPTGWLMSISYHIQGDSFKTDDAYVSWIKWWYKIVLLDIKNWFLTNKNEEKLGKVKYNEE